jgi:D-tyrosyl-tRNA(Tyr) deacylase
MTEAMRALLQRVNNCRVSVNGRVVGSIQKGVLVLLGVKRDDTVEEARSLARRCCALRIFDDEQGKMNLSVSDVGGEMMVVSQFTLYGDARKGNRPNYSSAASAEHAEQLYEEFIEEARRVLGKERVASGQFRAMMQVELVNDGPVTVLIESKREESGE